MILLVGDYARGASRNASMSPAAAARLLRGLAAPCGVFAIQGNHEMCIRDRIQPHDVNVGKEKQVNP